jgi:hypothetical protein
MKLFESELQYLSELYQKLGTELARIAGDAAPGNAPASAEFLHKNRDLIARIEQMNVRVAQLAGEWETFHSRIDPQSRERTVRLAVEVRNRARLLGGACEENRRLLERRRSDLEGNLQELRRGASYLESIKPVKANYPKFVDSVG